MSHHLSHRLLHWTSSPRNEAAWRLGPWSLNMLIKRFILGEAATAVWRLKHPLSSLSSFSTSPQRPFFHLTASSWIASGGRASRLEGTPPSTWSTPRWMIMAPMPAQSETPQMSTALQPRTLCSLSHLKVRGMFCHDLYVGLWKTIHRV